MSRSQITVNQTNRWAGPVFRGSAWSPANVKEELKPSGGGLDKSKLVAKIWGRRVRQKTPVAKKKYLLKTVALAVKMWRKSKAIESNQGIELRAGGGIHRPEKPGWSASGMENVARKRKNNNKQHHKNNTEWRTTTNIIKTSWRFSQAKYHRWEFLLSLQK